MIQSYLKRKYSFTVTFTLAELLLAFFFLLFSVYIIWEVYWWNKIGLYFIKWHTHIVFTAIWVALLFCLPLFLLSNLVKKNTGAKMQSLAIGAWLACVVLELIFVLFNVNKTYSEVRAGYYRSPFAPEADNYYHIYHVSDSFESSALEFSFKIKNNSLGYVGKEWSVAKQKVKRVIVLGDSFTEGDGAPMDSSYPAQMQTILGPAYEVLNAGVRGSDPVFGLKNFEDRLAHFKPDLVLQTISENDVLFDFCVRGGYERFQADSTVKFRSSPWWESIYAMSYLSRVFFHAFGLNLKEPCGNIQNADFIAKQNNFLIDVLTRFEAKAAALNCNVVIVFFPTKFEVFRNGYDFDFSVAKTFINQLPHVHYIDLFPCYREKIKQSGMADKDFYWVIDGHHNSFGYNLMASCVAEEVLKLNLDTVAN